MSEGNQFWQYAKEATLSACYAQSGHDKENLLELARIWTQAALQERASMDDHDTPAEAIVEDEVRPCEQYCSEMHGAEDHYACLRDAPIE